MLHPIRSERCFIYPTHGIQGLLLTVDHSPMYTNGSTAPWIHYPQSITRYQGTDAICTTLIMASPEARHQIEASLLDEPLTQAFNGHGAWVTEPRV